MKQSKTRYVILGLLSETDLSGYEIKKIIDTRFSFFWHESYGQLYPELKNLARLGRIRETPADAHMLQAQPAGGKEPSKREKTLYSLTPEGRQELLAWLAEPPEKESVRFELLLKMYFSSHIDASVIHSHIRAFRDSHREQLAMLDSFQAELLRIRGEHDNHEDVLRIIDFGQRVYKAYLDWCQETMGYLERRMAT